MSSPRTRKLIRHTLEITTWSFFSITLACIMMGLSLKFPSSGLDPSWKFAANEAAAQGMSFGKDFIFTFGPYSSLYTGIYHPAIDSLMLFSGMLLTLGLASSLFILYGRQNYFLLVLTCIFLAAYKQTDALLFFFPLSLSLTVNKLFTTTAQSEKTRETYNTIITISLFSILGLLPLIKISTALTCFTTILISGSYAILIRRYVLALGIFTSPIFMMFFLWIIAGQKPEDLIAFFQNSAPIVSGYTEAMSTYGSNYEIVLFILTCLWGLIALIRSEHQQRIRIYIALNFALYLFLSFKAGFTRHDGHAMIAGSAIVMAGLALTAIYRKLGVLTWLLCGCFATWFFIESHHSSITITDTTNRIKNRYINSWTGLHNRIFDSQSIKDEYNKSILKLTKELQLPHLNGTSDIYSYQQSYLLASGNTWHPRPIIQSYSVYTSKLAKINSDFLARQGADNIFFNVETIDGRLPSLDDGASWPILLTNYDIVGSDSNFLQLKRKSQSVAPVIVPEKQAFVSGQIGKTIKIPTQKGNVFMQVDLQPNLLGRIRGILFKQSMLKIVITTRNQQEFSYRFIPSMANSTFLISPLVKTNYDFLNFASREKMSALPNEVISFRLEGSNSPLSGWKRDFKVNFISYALPPTGQGLIKYNPALDDITSNLPKRQVMCNGVIDSINQQVPPPINVSAGSLSVEGWLVPANDTKANPNDTYVYVYDEAKRYSFYSTQKTPRLDVKAYLGTPDIADLGYKSNFLTNELSGNYEIGLARKVGEYIELCEQPKVRIRIENLN